MLRRAVSYILMSIGGILMVSGIALAVMNWQNYMDIMRYAFLALFGVLILAIGITLYEEDIYAEIHR